MSHELDAEARSNRTSSPKLMCASFKLENLDFNRQRPALRGKLKMQIKSNLADSPNTELDHQQDQQLSSARVGAIQNQTPASRTAPKIYPNNTLVEDLSKCHENLQPKLVQAARRVLRPVGGSCWSRPKSELATARTDPTKSAADQIDDINVCDKNVERPHEFTMPHSLVRLNSTLTPDDYNRALSILTRDMRYKLHLLLFSRLQLAWTLVSTTICVLVYLLTFTIISALTMAVVWFLLQTTGFIACKQTRKLLNKMLERSVAQTNTFFMDHKLMLGVINVGGFWTQSRFVVPMLYFDAVQCIEQVDSNIERDLLAMRNVHQDQERNESQLSSLETNQNHLARSQLAKKIVLDFSQRWVVHFDQSKLLLADDGSKPRHLSTGKCLCQFIEETLRTEADGQISLEDESQTGSLKTSRRQSVELTDEGNDTKVDIWNERRGPVRAQLVKTNATRAFMGTNSAGEYIELSAIDLMEVSRRIDPGAANKPQETTGDNDSEAPGQLVDCFAHPLKQERASESRSSLGSELSLDLLSDDQHQDQSGTLFKKLKLLFELRANELSQNLDGKSAVALVDWGKISPSNLTLPEQERDRQMVSLEIGGISNGRESSDYLATDGQTSPPGKRFFARFDGLFSIGLIRGRRRGLYTSSSRQMLDIS